VPWDYRFADRAFKQLRKLDQRTQQEIVLYCEKRLKGRIDPRGFGHALTGQFRGMWRYRIGDYRLICEIKDRELTVLVFQVGHRREVYR
jgi:mRNA interferase RelE/StbE